MRSMKRAFLFMILFIAVAVVAAIKEEKALAAMWAFGAACWLVISVRNYNLNKRNDRGQQV